MGADKWFCVAIFDGKSYWVIDDNEFLVLLLLLNILNA